MIRLVSDSLGDSMQGRENTAVNIFAAVQIRRCCFPAWMQYTCPEDFKCYPKKKKQNRKLFQNLKWKCFILKMSKHCAFLQKKKIWSQCCLASSGVLLTSSSNSLLVCSTVEVASKIVCTVWYMSILKRHQEIG